MHAKRIIGAILFALGVAFLVFASQPINGPSEYLSNSMATRYDMDKLWFLLGGIATTVCGGVLTMSGSRRRRIRNTSNLFRRGL